MDSVALAKKLVKAGLEYSIVTSTAIRDEVARGEIVAKPITRPSTRSSLALTTLREQPMSRFAIASTEMLREKLV
ncbi:MULTISPECIES: LysR substrate-binding domain-containing protein [Paraburkholderia]|uniref:LysR substrate-binding domain-containing protein n=1 Tax=Paraburkholderia largidicola TaxID=3014751 RepID=A0A7I8C3U8_9BURK|nr:MULTISPECIES: LysR substrate-binding domain-containing protein [Paraburkholderia]BCF94710.1 hypothetical protein PPGU16_77770 [Paraburkholderia sp. PGU16]GJH05574.1 hypothetical protein CBA19C8_33475 [Paraburkholderia terrae]